MPRLLQPISDDECQLREDAEADRLREAEDGNPRARELHYADTRMQDDIGDDWEEEFFEEDE